MLVGSDGPSSWVVDQEVSSLLVVVHLPRVVLVPGVGDLVLEIQDHQEGVHHVGLVQVEEVQEHDRCILVRDQEVGHHVDRVDGRLLDLLQKVELRQGKGLEHRNLQVVLRVDQVELW